MKRLALRLSQEGEFAYISYSDYMPRPADVFNALRLINKRTILIFDNAENTIYGINKLGDDIEVGLIK